MAVVDVLNSSGEKVSEIDLVDDIFNVPVKPNVLHDVVTMQLTNRRSGDASVKRRSEVRGSQRKLFRQKGTGRARRGNIKSPLLRGGGVVFGPKPKTHAVKVPKKVRRLALKMALSAKLRANGIVVLDQLELAEIKTRAFLAVATALEAENALFVTDRTDEILERSSRNVPGIKVLRCEGLNVYDILKHEKLVLVAGSVKGIEGRLLS